MANLLELKQELLDLMTQQQKQDGHIDPEIIKQYERLCEYIENLEKTLTN